MTSVRCPNCNLPNPATRAVCARCRTELGIRSGSAPSGSGVGGHAESIASVLYLVAFVLSCAGGGAVIALAHWLIGEEAMQNDVVLIGGFMIGTVGSLMAMIYGIRRWKARAQGVPHRGGIVHDPLPAAPPASRKELLVGGVLLALFGAFIVYYFAEWEREGGERTINSILYGLYMLLGKWGVGALMWITSAVMVWKGIKRD